MFSLYLNLSINAKIAADIENLRSDYACVPNPKTEKNPWSTLYQKCQLYQVVGGIPK
jgi:hypothetical protein